MNYLLPTIFFFLLTSCAFKVSERELKWRSGDASESLSHAQGELSEQSWKDESSTEFAGFKIVQRTQIIDGRIIPDAKYKFATDLKSLKPTLLVANYKKKGLFPLFQDKTDRSDLLTQFKKQHVEFQNLKSDLPEAVLIESGSQFISLWKVIFEDKLDAKEVLFYKNLSIHSTQTVSSEFDAQATVFPKGPKRSELTQVLLTELSDFTKLSSSRVIVQSEIPDSSLNIKEPLAYEPRDPRFDQVQAYFNLDSSLKWFETKFGYKPSRKIEAVLHLSYPEKTNAAFYYAGKIRVGTGDGVNYAHLAQDSSIMIHESAHSVIESVARLPTDGEGGSLNEGFADFFAAAQLGNPFMGEVSYLKGPYKRSLLTVVKYHEKNGGLYHDSLILSGLLWDFYQVLGEAKSLKIASRLLVEMHSQSDFQELKNILPMVINDVLEPGDLRKAKKILQDREF